MAVKDQMYAKGLPTTAGSSILNDVAKSDATVVARLRKPENPGPSESR